MRFFIQIALAAFVLGACASEQKSQPTSVSTFANKAVNSTALAKQLFGAKRSASAQRPAPYGSYSKGCVAGAAQLPETGPTWQAMRLSRNRNWGHPEVIDFIQDLSPWGRVMVPLTS